MGEKPREFHRASLEGRSQSYVRHGSECLFFKLEVLDGWKSGNPAPWGEKSCSQCHSNDRMTLVSFCHYVSAIKQNLSHPKFACGQIICIKTK